MKLLIVGAGAIGSLIGGRLALAGENVTLVGRPWLREAIAAHGLTIVTSGEARTVGTLRVATSVEEAWQVGASSASGPPYDLVILTMKAYAVAAAIAELGAVAATPPPILTFQNGVGSEEIVAERFGPESVIAGTITTPVEVAGPARITTVNKGGIGLAPLVPLSAHSPPLEELAARFTAAGFVVARYADAPAMKWSKLLLNVMGNATSAILGMPPEAVFGHPGLYAVELDALAEARRVMARQGVATVSLPGYPVPLLMTLLERLPRGISRPLMRRQIASGRGGKMPSLFLDLQAGRRELEIDVLNGAVVAAGERVGVPTPVNRALTEIVGGLAADCVDPARFRNNPEALLAAVYHPSRQER